MSVHAYVNFAGRCREAVEFYAAAFDSPQPKIMSYADAPPNPEFPLPPDARKLVMHAELELDGGRLMLADMPPGVPLTPGNHISLIVMSKDPARLRKAWDRLKAGGSVTMELGPQFWTPLYGYLVDKFGIGWQLSQEE